MLNTNFERELKIILLHQAQGSQSTVVTLLDKNILIVMFSTTNKDGPFNILNK